MRACYRFSPIHWYQ